MLKIPSNCCGCTACASACVKNCIEMRPNAEGFLYPVLDEARCIDCGLCEASCPIGKAAAHGTPLAFGAVSKDSDVRGVSSSGGVFSLLADAVISKGGAVFGAAFDSEFNVIHIKAEAPDEVARIRTSKYVQSNIGNSYGEAKAILDVGRYVLFTGTACQIAGLKSYLRRDYEKLYTQDVFCLGVPSPEVWRAYINEKSAGKNAVSVSFRHKLEDTYALRFSFDDGSEIIERSTDCLYTKAFVGKLSLRESCYDCAFKGLSRASDITLADFWGVGKLCPELDDGKGVSLVLLHSDKGVALFESIKDSLKYKKVDVFPAVEENPMAVHSAHRDKARDVFMASYKRQGLAKAYDKATKPALKLRTKRFIKKSSVDSIISEADTYTLHKGCELVWAGTYLLMSVRLCLPNIFWKTAVPCGLLLHGLDFQNQRCTRI